MGIKPMTVNLDDVPTEALSEPYKFLATGDESLLGRLDKGEIIYIMNQAAGVGRVDSPGGDGDARSSVAIVPADEAGDDALDVHEYTSNVTRRELEVWAAEFGFEG